MMDSTRGAAGIGFNGHHFFSGHSLQGLYLAPTNNEYIRTITRPRFGTHTRAAPLTAQPNWNLLTREGEGKSKHPSKTITAWKRGVHGHSNSCVIL